MSYNGYNGWKNYPTWDFNVWIGEDDHHWLAEVVNSCDDRYALASYLNDYLQELADSYQLEGIFADLLEYAIDQIDFGELASRYWDAYRASDDDGD